MTLTITALLEWRRAEKESSDMQIPVPLQDIHEYLKRLRDECAESQLPPDPDGEYAAARECLEDICRIRRDKLARAAIICDPPAPSKMWDFEGWTWFGLTGKYQFLDGSYQGVYLGHAPQDMKDFGKPKTDGKMGAH